MWLILFVHFESSVMVGPQKPLNPDGITAFGFTTLANKTDTLPCNCMTVVLRLDNLSVTDF